MKRIRRRTHYLLKGKAMCDMTAVSILLGSAKATFLATLVLLGIAILNATNLFTAAGNVALMVTVISLTAVSTGCYIAALVLVDQCADVCSAEFAELRLMLISLLSLMAVFTALLITISLVAAFPWIGSAAVGLGLAWGIGLTTAISGAAEWRFAAAVNAFNACRERNAVATINVIVVVLAYGIVAAASLVDGYGYFSGKIPAGLKL
jgi:hypothetical protein